MRGQYLGNGFFLILRSNKIKKKENNPFSFSFLKTKLIIGKNWGEPTHSFLMLVTVSSEDFAGPVTSKPSQNGNGWDCCRWELQCFNPHSQGHSSSSSVKRPRGFQNPEHFYCDFVQKKKKWVYQKIVLSQPSLREPLENNEVLIFVCKCTIWGHETAVRFLFLKKKKNYNNYFEIVWTGRG